jgi:hypothetical protein
MTVLTAIRVFVTILKGFWQIPEKVAYVPPWIEKTIKHP